MLYCRRIRPFRLILIHLTALLIAPLVSCAQQPDGEAPPQPELDRAAEPPAEVTNLPETETVAQVFEGSDLRTWQPRQVQGETALVSPPALTSGWEQNHHEITVEYTGSGRVLVGLMFNSNNNLEAAATRNHLSRGPRAVGSGSSTTFTCPYKGHMASWVFLRAEGDVAIQRVRHQFWRGRGTLYGHVGRTHEFAGAELPYRLMYPRNYDPNRAYPLVVSVAGSGSTGNDNVRNMEMVILARHLFTDFYDDPDLACFSLVPQIPAAADIPAPYHPAGPQGAPDRFHPDWPGVNENGWFVQGTLSLIEQLQQDPNLSIDPDRIYYTGFSYGGKACWEFLKAGRELFAGAICGAGWPIGPAFSRPTGPYLDRLRLEAERYKHIPVRIYAGQRDRMNLGSAAANEVLQAAGADSEYIEIPGVEHVQSAGRIWGNRDHILWLFRQDRADNPDPGVDPYPDGVYDQ